MISNTPPRGENGEWSICWCNISIGGTRRKQGRLWRRGSKKKEVGVTLLYLDIKEYEGKKREYIIF